MLINEYLKELLSKLMARVAPKKELKLNEITHLFRIDCGGTCPKVFIDDGKTYVSFFTDLSEEEWKSNIDPWQGRILISFENSIYATFGGPSSDTIYGHPYHKYGLSSCGFYQLENSALIQYLENINKVHPYHNSERWKHYKHFILTFHDDMFECVAVDFQITPVDADLYNNESAIFKELDKKF